MFLMNEICGRDTFDVPNGDMFKYVDIEHLPNIVKNTFNVS